jgi:hypothetical protein
VIEYELKPYTGTCPLYAGMWVAQVKIKGFLTEDAFEAILDKAGYNSILKNIYERSDIYNKVFLSYIMRGYKICIRGEGFFYPYIMPIPFKLDRFDPERDISKIYIYREPKKFLCREIEIKKGDLKRYEGNSFEEGRLF